MIQRLNVRTENTTYKIMRFSDGREFIKGHAIYCPRWSPTKTTIFRVGIPMVFKNPLAGQPKHGRAYVLTSPVQRMWATIPRPTARVPERRVDRSNPNALARGGGRENVNERQSCS